MIKANKVILAGMCLLLAGACLSCKGRTMKNMEPTGDTVEVQIAPLTTEDEEDTVANVASSEAAL